MSVRAISALGGIKYGGRPFQQFKTYCLFQSRFLGQAPAMPQPQLRIAARQIHSAGPALPHSTDSILRPHSGTVTRAAAPMYGEKSQCQCDCFSTCRAVLLTAGMIVGCFAAFRPLHGHAFRAPAR